MTGIPEEGLNDPTPSLHEGMSIVNKPHLGGPLQVVTDVLTQMMDGCYAQKTVCFKISERKKTVPRMEVRMPKGI